jgi:hypothetical protein
MIIYILGETSFLAKNFYIYLKKYYNEIYLINYRNITYLKNIKEDDVLINFCGVNRANNWEDYNKGNSMFLKKILNTIKAEPYFLHISSYMIYGFKDKPIDTLSDYQKWFIKSKLEGENYLKNSYSREKLCIIHPTNIYGYNCIPYYNNIVSTLIYEKITKKNIINKINKNCIRNILSISGFCSKLYEMIENRVFGSYNIISNNNISLKELVEYVHNTTPLNIEYFEGEYDEMNRDILDNTIIVEENIVDNIRTLENNMRVYLELKEQVIVSKPDILSQPRGVMVEISNLNSKRLYKITLACHAVRGNHFHYKQIEEFFTNRGHALYLLSHKDNPDIIYIIKMEENTLLKIQPNIIHTLTNDYIDNCPEIIITSTQKYIAGKIPDTTYINNI